VGENICGLRPHRTCRKGIGRTFQIPKPLLGLTVLDNVMIAAYPKSHSKHQAADRAKDALILSGLWEKKDFLAKHLTLAEKKLLEVTRALTSNPTLLLLDEVMAGLNEKERERAISLIDKIRERKISILVIEHIFKIIATITDRVIVLDQGIKIAEGNPNEVIRHERVIKAYFGADYAFA
jgi:branched-chain amino acid transport system ATP-binding protein